MTENANFFHQLKKAENSSFSFLKILTILCFEIIEKCSYEKFANKCLHKSGDVIPDVS